jgi:hypothetical protein
MRGSVDCVGASRLRILPASAVVCSAFQLTKSLGRDPSAPPAGPFDAAQDVAAAATDPALWKPLPRLSWKNGPVSLRGEGLRRMRGSVDCLGGVVQPLPPCRAPLSAGAERGCGEAHSIGDLPGLA